MSSHQRNKDASPTRRTFVKALAMAPALPSILVGSAVASPQQSPPAEALPVTAALVEVVRVRYGKQLTADQLVEIKQGLERSARSSQRLRSVKLKNSDEPDFMFRV